MDEFKPGDELSHVWLAEALKLPGFVESHLQAEKHKLKLVAHPKGVLMEWRAETYLLGDAGILAVKKAKPKPVEAKK